MRTSLAQRTTQRLLRAALLAALVGAAQFQGAAQSQEPDVEAESAPPPNQTPATTLPPGLPLTITTSTLGMSGWRPDPVRIVRTFRLGMSGWRREPVTIATPSLAMTGWRPGPRIIEAPRLGMTGWQSDPMVVTTNAFGMTGWGGLAAECTPPLVRDSRGKRCVCPTGLPQSDGQCAPAGAGSPPDLRVEIDGADTCEAGQACRFETLVVNVGDGPYRGPLVVQHEASPPYAQQSTAGTGWTCAGGLCIRPDITLPSGGLERLTVDVRLPADTAEISRIRQCAELEAADPGEEPVRFVQLMLRAAGIDAGPPDNQMGQRTRSAIETFRSRVGLDSAPEIDAALIDALSGLMPADSNPGNDRACAEARLAPPPG